MNFGLPRSHHTVGLRAQDTNRTRKRTRGIASRGDDKERNATTTASRKNAVKAARVETEKRERGRERERGRDEKIAV